MLESRLHVENVLRPNLHRPHKKTAIFKLFRKNLHQYLINSTLHGLKYVGDRTITRFERYLEIFAIYFATNFLHKICFRYFFAMTFTLVLIFSTYFITNIWTKWTQAPLIITQSAMSIPVDELPFPGITFNLSMKISSKLTF